MISAQTMPEDLRYRIIRERYDKSADAPYVPDAARIIVRMAEHAIPVVHRTRP